MHESCPLKDQERLSQYGEDKSPPMAAVRVLWRCTMVGQRCCWRIYTGASTTGEPAESQGYRFRQGHQASETTTLRWRAVSRKPFSKCSEIGVTGSTFRAEGESQKERPSPPCPSETGRDVPLLQANFSDLNRPSSRRQMSGEVRLGIGLNCTPGGVSFRAGCRLAQSHPRHGPSPRGAPRRLESNRTSCVQIGDWGYVCTGFFPPSGRLHLSTFN